MKNVFSAYANYYDLLYADKDYAGEAAFVHSLLAEHGAPNGSLLDLGCGTGKHAVEFARLGYDVTGIDRSQEMVALAEAQIPKALSDRLSFAVGDVRVTNLCKTFDAVTALFHVASYQTDNKSISAMFNVAKHQLRKGGVFLFDCWYGPAVLTRPPEIRIKRVATTENKLIRIIEPQKSKRHHTVALHVSIFCGISGSNLFDLIEERHSMRFFFHDELKDFLLDAGFELMTACEWRTGNELGTETWNATFISRRAIPDEQDPA